MTRDITVVKPGRTERLQRDVAENRNLGDTSTLADSSIVEELQRRSVENAGKEE
jgi:acetyl-CoA synthetase